MVYKKLGALEKRNVEYHSMPMGIKNAPVASQCLMNTVLTKMQNTGVFAYLVSRAFYAQALAE